MNNEFDDSNEERSERSESEVSQIWTESDFADIIHDQIYESVTDITELFVISSYLPTIIKIQNQRALYPIIKHFRINMSFFKNGGEFIEYVGRTLPSLKHLNLSDITYKSVKGYNKKLERYMEAVSTIQTIECLELSTKMGELDMGDEYDDVEDDVDELINQLNNQNIDDDINLGARVNTGGGRRAPNERPEREVKVFEPLKNLPNLTELILSLTHITNDGASLKYCQKLNRLSLVLAPNSYSDGFSFIHIFNMPSIQTLIVDFEDNPVSFIPESPYSARYNSNINNLTVACMSLGTGFLEVQNLRKLKYLTVIIPDGVFTQEDLDIYETVVESFGGNLIVNISDVNSD